MPINIFISYSHKDERYREELVAHLSNLKRQDIIAAWYDREISPGADWASEIDTNLNNAQIILLLISSDFMNSEYCNGIEMKQALERHEAREALVIPIILRPVDWEDAPFANLQVRPTYARPVSKWDDHDEAYLDIVQGIRMAINELKPASEKRPDDDLSLVRQSNFHVPFLRNPYFTGREDILTRLHNRLISSMTPLPQVISGLGGIGKTQTAVEYAYSYSDDYQYVFWVKADSSENLTSDFCSLAGLLNLPVKDEKDQNLIISAVKNWLHTHTGWLLILDNVENLEMVRDYLPLGSKGHMLMTTNAPVTEIEFQEVELKDMKPEESELFLLRRARIIELDASPDTASETDRSKAHEISEIMGGLPLALSQAGAYIDKTKCGLANFQDRYRKQKAKLLEDPRGLVSDHPESIATTWSLSFDRVEQANPAAADLLRLCAFLHPDAIPEELIIEGASELTPGLQSIDVDPSVLDDAILELLRYSLVRRNPDATLTIHRLLQAVLKDGMDERTQRQWAERTVRAVNRVFPDVEFDTWSRCQRYLAQVQVCKALIDEWGMESEEAARLLDQAGDYLRERGQYTEAEPLLIKSLALREKILGPEHPSLALSLHNMARLYHDQGKYTKAEPLYQQALAMREKSLGSEHPDLAITLNYLGMLYFYLGKYAQAEPLHQQALAIREKVLGPEHSYIAHSLANLATLYQAQGKYAGAEPFYQRSVAICEQALGPEHPDVASGLGLLGGLYQAQGKYAEAEPLHQRALAIREKGLGAEHPDVAACLNSLGNLYQAQGKYTEAELLYQRALTISEKGLGAEHPDVAACLNSLGNLYQAQGKYTQALTDYQRALTIWKQAWGNDHPHVATCHMNIGEIYYYMSKYVWAEQHFQRAQTIQKKTLGPDHPDLAKTLNAQATLYGTQGQYDKAKPLFRQALAIYEKALGPDHPDLATFLENYAAILRRAKQTREAIPLEERASAIRIKHAQENPV